MIMTIVFRFLFFVAVAISVSNADITGTVSTKNELNTVDRWQSKKLGGNWAFKTDPNNKGIEQRWYAIEKPDKSWKPIRTGLQWEKQGFGGYDGIAWYWCRTIVPADWKRIYLYLPEVDDAYTLYVNGKEVCRDGAVNHSLARWATSHEITEFLSSDKSATITLRVEDYGYEGGLIRGPVEIRNYPSQMDITKDWKFRLDPQNEGIQNKWYGADCKDTDWAIIQCGSDWESQNYAYDGIAWYRKEVEIPAAWTEQVIFLEMPFVDDSFDLYIDGGFIHHYGTPENLCWGQNIKVDVTQNLSCGKKHLLAVRVWDRGALGGIKGNPVLSVQYPIYRVAKDRDYSYLTKDRDPQAPRIGPYSCQTALENRPYNGICPVLLGGRDVTWSLIEGPVGLVVDPNSGRPNWKNPVVGPEAYKGNVIEWEYPVVLEARNSYGYDYAFFYLKVIEEEGQLLCIIQTQYIDWVVNKDIAKWFQENRPHKVIDRQWELLRDLIGHEPGTGRQVVKYQYDMGRWGLSGNTVKVGPGFWSTDKYDGWGLGIWLHEVGHCFNGQTFMHEYSNNGPYGGIYHHFCEFTSQYIFRYTDTYPEQFEFNAANLKTHHQFIAGLEKKIAEGYRGFETWSSQHDDVSQSTDDPYGVWGKVVYDIIDQYGYESIDICVRTMRSEGIPSAIRQRADSVEKKNSLLFCIMSCAVKNDLRDYFRGKKFKFDNVFYQQIKPEVEKVINTLPREDIKGWKKNPQNGHFYRRTPGVMSWFEAEQFAQSVGGHLVCINDEKECQWLASRFGIYGEFWAGGYRRENKWAWISGENMDFLPWQGGYPMDAQDFNLAVFHPSDQRISTQNDLFRIFGVVETKALPEVDYPGFKIEYSD